jgi:replicative DNA helicase
MSGEIPPHDDAAELAVLATVFQYGTLDLVRDLLRPDSFYNAGNRWIYEACLELDAKGKPVDLNTVAGCLADHGRLGIIDREVFADLPTRVVYRKHTEVYAQTILDKQRLRRVIECGRSIAAEGYGDVGDIQEWINSKEQEVYALAHTEEQSGPVHIADVLRETFEEISRLADGNGISGYESGLADLDRVTGGFQPGELIIVAGRPGMGKSSLVTTFADHLASGKEPAGSIIFSLEMPRKQVVLRMACADAGVDTNRVRRNELQPDDWSALAASTNRLSRLPVWIDDMSAIRPLDIRSRVRRRKAEFAKNGIKLGMVAVDYIQLCNGTDGVGRNGLREQEISYISRSLKALAKECAVPVVALAQLNRAVESRDDKRPMLSDLRESGQLEQDADLILMVYRHDYYSPECKQAAGIAELGVVKQRSGATGIVPVSFLRQVHEIWKPHQGRLKGLHGLDPIASGQQEGEDSRRRLTAD